MTDREQEEQEVQSCLSALETADSANHAELSAIWRNAYGCLRAARALALALLILSSGCSLLGYESSGSELTGQVKKVQHHTPVFCSNYDSVDVSLGVMKNGVGSMSTEDIWLTVPDQHVLDTLKAANRTGDLVRVTYDTRRAVLCIDDHIATSAEVVK